MKVQQAFCHSAVCCGRLHILLLLLIHLLLFLLLLLLLLLGCPLQLLTHFVEGQVCLQVCEVTYGLSVPSGS